MSTNTCHTIHFLIDAVGASASKLATLTSVMDVMNAFSNDFYNSLRGTGPVTPVTTLMPNGVASHKAIPQFSGMLVNLQNNPVFNNVKVGNCFGSVKAFVPRSDIYGIPAWVGNATVVDIPNLTEIPEAEVYPVYDSAWKNFSNSANASAVVVNNTITTPLRLSDRAVPSSSVNLPYNTVGRLIEVNEILWNALPAGDANTVGNTKYNVLAKHLLLALNHPGTAVSGSTQTLFSNAQANRKFAAVDLASMQTAWQWTKRSSCYKTPTFGPAH